LADDDTKEWGGAEESRRARGRGAAIKKTRAGVLHGGVMRPQVDRGLPNMEPRQAQVQDNKKKRVKYTRKRRPKRGKNFGHKTAHRSAKGPQSKRIRERSDLRGA